MRLLGPQEPQLTLADALIGRNVAVSEVITPTRTSGVDVVPSTIALSAADIILASVPGRETLLARRLRPVTGYDYILIDTPPSLGVLTVNSLTAAGDVFVPVGVGTFGLMGITLLEDTMAQLRENLELEGLAITGAIATLHDTTRVAKDTHAALQAHFGARLFGSVIPKNKDSEEANSRSMSILAYAPQSKGGQAYRALAAEVISREH